MVLREEWRIAVTGKNVQGSDWGFIRGRDMESAGLFMQSRMHFLIVPENRR